MRGKIRPSAAEIWDNFPIPLQGLPPSDLPFCNIMHIAYKLCVINLVISSFLFLTVDYNIS